MSERTVHVLVSGRVQGVWYRGSTEERARALGLRGWVRNLRDGRVEAVIRGAPEAVEDMLEWMRQGPPAARVEDLQVKDADETVGDDFEVRGTGG